jgi:nicotinamide-nucleotide amidase
MNAHIITIGDELLIGQVINTNQAHIGDALTSIGIDVTEMLTIGDSMDDILNAFGRSMSTAEVVIVTGGLGPTHDDITRKAVCTFFDTTMVPNPDVRRQIETFFAQRGRTWNAAAEEQSFTPKSAEVFPNPVGTAAGLRFVRDGHYFFVLPGVPYEMKEMMRESVLPYLTPRAGGQVIRRRTLKTSGVPESVLAERLGDIEGMLQGSSLAFLPSASGVRMRITVHASTPAEADAEVARIEARIREKVEKSIFGVDTEELEDVVGRLLKERGLTIAVAESCTGGRISSRITEVSGSSSYFERGVVTYSNASKTALLGVPAEMIAAHGAVSEEVARAMAEGIRRTAGTSIGISATGIAGPTGGTPEKPVGLVYVGYADAKESLVLRFRFGEGRDRVMERAGAAALELVRRKLLGMRA